MTLTPGSHDVGYLTRCRCPLPHVTILLIDVDPVCCYICTPCVDGYLPFTVVLPVDVADLTVTAPVVAPFERLPRLVAPPGACWTHSERTVLTVIYRCWWWCCYWTLVPCLTWT